jgi:O-antigen biosynthesis protein
VSRAARLRALARRALGRGGDGGGPLPVRLPPFMLEALRDGAVAPAPGGAQRADAPALDVAIVIPQFRRGSGGHKTIADLVRGLEARGHAVRLLLVDEEGRHAGASDAAVQASFRDFFGPVAAPLARVGQAADGRAVDVAVATGWQTVPAVLRLGGARARAYLVQDHEPEFYATSIEREWAAWTYRQGLHAICASPWLADVVRRDYRAGASSFDLGVDHAVYRPVAEAGPNAGAPPRVLFYARPTTPRRAVPLGLLALEELHRRRPDVQIALFGEARPLQAPFPHEHLGVLPPPDLARAYARATVGVVLSLTNPSLVPTEMLACGLPVVDLAVASMVETFGRDDALELVAPDPVALATAIERLIDDPGLRARRTEAGLRLVAARTWDHAAAQVEAGLRAALRQGR